MINWDNVEFAKESTSPYGDAYIEVHFGKQYVDVKETLQEIDEKCLHATAWKKLKTKPAAIGLASAST